MKAISIHQPWADLIVDGRRKMEIRKWNTNYRGPILIHAGLSVDVETCVRFSMMTGVIGAIIGSVDLITTKQLSEERWGRLRALHMEVGPRPYGDNTFAWFLANPRRLSSPIPRKGRQRFFEIPDNLIYREES